MMSQAILIQSISLAILIHKHAAHRLDQHMLQVVEVAWTDDSTLVIFYMRYRYCLHRAVVRKVGVQ